MRHALFGTAVRNLQPSNGTVSRLDDRARMMKRGALLIAAVVVAAGAALVARSWVTSDQSASRTGRATAVARAEAMTPAMAARIAKQLVETWAANQPVRVFHCNLATPRQRELCAFARPLTPAVVTAEILGRLPDRGARCIVQTEAGDLWTVSAGAAGRCL
jgi:hypothetical protein